MPSVGNGPGAIALNRRPYRPHSTANDCVIVFTADFDIADGTTNGPPFQIQVVRIEITLPRFPSSIQRLPILWVI